VTAASNWDEPPQRLRVRPSRPDSYEPLFHDVGIAQFALLLNEAGIREALRSPHLERAIGVIYRPETERGSHYFPARLPEQFDAAIHIDETHTLQPLEQWAHDELDLPETYPTALEGRCECADGDHHVANGDVEVAPANARLIATRIARRRARLSPFCRMRLFILKW
jgi:hypothetical protein